MFRYQAPFVVNEKGKVFDIEGGQDHENRNIIAYTKHGKINQQWDVIYVDEYAKEPTKGQLNKKFGLYVERPFYIVSQMNGGRYLDLINNRNMVIKPRKGRYTQDGWCDQKSLTIKTKLNNQSFDIKGSGNSKDMQIWSTNSRWW
jgi:hypothetical protein